MGWHQYAKQYFCVFLQALWKIGMAGEKQKEMLLNGLAERYRNCIEEKNCTLIRFDFIQGLRKLYDKEKDETSNKKHWSSSTQKMI
jgi:hypothetical protein